MAGSSDFPVALVFLLPALVGFTVFLLVPIVRGLSMSLTDWNLLSPPTYVGLDNFRRMLDDALFWNSLWVTLKYVVINIGSQTVIAVGLAVLMDRLTRSVWVRAIMVLPFLMPNVTVALLWLWMLDFRLGAVNQFLDFIGLGRVAFLGNTTWVIPTIAGINTWRHMGYTALLVFAGLQTIPKDLYEAAAVDGASEWSMFWRVTLPLLRPVLALVMVVTVVGSFQIFDTIAVTTTGGPINASRVIYFYIFERGFQMFQMGYAAAMSVALFVILFSVALIQLRLLRANRAVED